MSDTGAWSFAKAVHDLLGLDGFPLTPDLRVTSFSDAGMAQAFSALEEGTTTAARRSLYHAKALQRRFEYNWWLNANALLRPALARAGLHDERAPSKYELQLLYALRGRDPLSMEGVLGLMRTWSGSGKYAALSLGSPKSRAPMIENLIRMRALESSVHGLALSLAGQKLLSLLPKDCEDPDLPMRLLNWKSQPTSSVLKVEAYLFKWFGKVKRILDSPQ